MKNSLETIKEIQKDYLMYSALMPITEWLETAIDEFNIDDLKEFIRLKGWNYKIVNGMVKRK